jgi:hypothetical protein
MERIVHIIPLGWDYDRAVLPVEFIKAHRVYLLCNPSGQPLRARYLERVVRKFDASRLDVRVVQVDTFQDLLGTMSEVSTIIRRELAEGNRIFINVATSGKIAAIAATLAAMAHLPPDRGLVYYVAAKDYPRSKPAQLRHGIASGMDGEPFPLPLFRINLPDADCRLVLSALRSTPDRTLRYKRLIQVLRDRKVSGFEEAPPRGLGGRRLRTLENVRFHQRIVRKLDRAGLVSILERGRTRSLHLTSAGAQVASLCE